MAGKTIDMSNLNNMTTDPLMDQTVGILIGSNPPKELSSTENETSVQPQKQTAHKPGPKKKEKQHEEKTTYNYRKEKRNIKGVGVVDKVVSEKGEIIGRPSKPIKEKKKPITLTLSPDLYDLVKKRAAADHRTTSEYLAMIIEKHFKK